MINCIIVNRQKIVEITTLYAAKQPQTSAKIKMNLIKKNYTTKSTEELIWKLWMNSQNYTKIDYRRTKKIFTGVIKMNRVDQSWDKIEINLEHVSNEVEGEERWQHKQRNALVQPRSQRQM